MWLCVNSRAAVEAGKVLEGRLRGEEPLFLVRVGKAESILVIHTITPSYVPSEGPMP